LYVSVLKFFQCLGENTCSLQPAVKNAAPIVRVKLQINLQLTGKILLKFDFSSSVLLEYGYFCMKLISVKFSVVICATVRHKDMIFTKQLKREWALKFLTLYKYHLA